MLENRQQNASGNGSRTRRKIPPYTGITHQNSIGDLLIEAKAIKKMFQMKIYSSQILALIFIIFLTGCAGINIVAANQTIIVNEDLSGSISRSIALAETEYEQVGSYYGLADPSGYIAQDMAQNLYWSVYESDHWSDNGREWIRVTAQFSNPDELYDLMYAVFSDTSEGSGGSADGIEELNDEEFPPFALSKTEHFFYTEYRLEGTLLALAATGDSIIESTFDSRLPGKIVEEKTDGQILADGQTVSWQWGRYDYVPYHHVTRITHTGRIVLSVFVIGGAAIGIFVGIIFLKNNKAKRHLHPSY